LIGVKANFNNISTISWREQIFLLTPKKPFTLKHAYL